jgi:hypothetical protein
MNAALAYTPWGKQTAEPRYAPANDNHSRWAMIGLTGLRNVGKSTVANLLEREFGFRKIHAFESGKEAAVTWFAEATGDIDRAVRMVHGDLKDKPCADLPGGVAPRYFLERFGKFMGVEMGIEWTLAIEVAKARREAPGRPIVVESVVYEADWFRAQGGVVWRLERPGHNSPTGRDSDAAQALIREDFVLSASTLDELERKARAAAQQAVGGG